MLRNRTGICSLQYLQIRIRFRFRHYSKMTYHLWLENKMEQGT
jgi:hypothetical protein